jgi:hypothetical protein
MVMESSIPILCSRSRAVANSENGLVHYISAKRAAQGAQIALEPAVSAALRVHDAYCMDDGRMVAVAELVADLPPASASHFVREVHRDLARARDAPGTLWGGHVLGAKPIPATNHSLDGGNARHRACHPRSALMRRQICEPALSDTPAMREAARIVSAPFAIASANVAFAPAGSRRFFGM